MNNDLLNALYLEYDVKFGVLSDSVNEKVKRIIGTDLTLVEHKQTNKNYLLVPLTTNHSFEYYPNSIIIDGGCIKSDMYWQQDGCQWVEL